MDQRISGHAAMTAHYFFGYGSLVNSRTHAFEDAYPARLTGWKRAWVATDLRPFAFLSAEPDANSTIDGLIAPVPCNDWAALDQREFAYDRFDTGTSVSHSQPNTPQIAVYSVSPERRIAPAAPPDILLSYVDVVVQGYLAVFGEAGVASFFATTDNWNTQVIDDRAAPIYPRHQVLTAAETALVDHFLATKDVTRLPPT
ncbi:gamma-glutamylcyclotransferase family protein [Shimia sp. SK013]|uniref:gamma-glutamylcyclotransferase family protein n=1 Tax=Shimia sp. SK013 TaxID=1389006 RepID=UPI001F4C6031|nr:gamma-glutamylcyclotransferase family protein [Shimia sp. SK013]